jgi:selenide,water dikinase
MVPGMIAGQYRAADLEIDGVALARRARARVVCEPAASVSSSLRTVSTESGASIEYDWTSLDVGSTVVGRELPGVADHALPARPMHCLIAGVDDLIERARVLAGHKTFRLAIVGAGAGGVELAFCFERRLRRDAGRAVSVTLLDRSEAPLPGSPAALSRRVSRVLARRGVRFRGGAEVAALEGPNTLLADGTKVEAEAVVWVPGPAAHAFLGNGDLPLDHHGFVRIGPTLQVEGSERLFAVGDCASLPGMQKAGVYAVRSGPILADNLRRALTGQPLRRYAPQREFLSLLNLGDGTALGCKRGIPFEGRWVMRLKDRIDRGFMERYR